MCSLKHLERERTERFKISLRSALPKKVLLRLTVSKLGVGVLLRLIVSKLGVGHCLKVW